jgi:hypothetical protein
VLERASAVGGDGDAAGAWELVHRWIDEASSPDEAHLYGPVLRALLEVGEEWRQRIAAAAAENRRIASCLADTLDREPQLFDDVIGRDHLLATWTRHQGERSDWDFWAVAAVMDGAPRWGPEGIWRLILDLAERSDDPEVLMMVGVGPVEDLVHHDWQFAIRCIERDAPRSERLRLALWSVWELGGNGIPDDVTARIHRASNQPPGTPHRY